MQAELHLAFYFVFQSVQRIWKKILEVVNNVLYIVGYTK
jgi:hypothetical protein